MARRSIFHSQTVDIVTGEIVEYRKDWVSRNTEMFGMYRTTDGLFWLKQFNEKELKLMMLLQEYSDMSTSYIALSQERRKEICSFLGLGNQKSLSSVLKRLCEKDGACRVSGSNNDFMVNPMCFFKGSTRDIKARIEKYHELSK